MSLRLGETTENAIKEDSYQTPHHKPRHRSSKQTRPRPEDDTVETSRSEKETSQSEKDSSNDDKEIDQSNENTKARQSETGVPDIDTATDQPETDESDDSEQGDHAETTSSDDKSEKHEELKDGLEGLFQTLQSCTNES